MAKKLARVPTASPDGPEQLAAFVDLGNAIVSSLDFNEVVQRILDVTQRLLRADVVTLRLLHAPSGTLRLVGLSGLSGDFAADSYTVKVGESVVGRAIAERRPYPVRDVQDSPFLFRDLAARRRLRSLLSIPIQFRNLVLGGLTAYWHKPHDHPDAEVRLMTAIGAQAAVAIENAQKYTDSIHSLLALARALESKDTYTVGHSERVTRIAVALAQEMRLPLEEVNLLRQVCPLHDVGKVGVPERILQKGSSLTPAERRQMAQHTTIGFKILQPIRLFREGLGIVRHHHERLDGAGYPDRLSGEEIPRVARVTTVADAFDAMTSRRPYRDALPLEDALGEIRRGAGTQFDTRAARTLLRLARERDPRILDFAAAARPPARAAASRKS